jgi:hypothetical protein
VALSSRYTVPMISYSLAITAADLPVQQARNPTVYVVTSFRSSKNGHYAGWRSGFATG